MKAKGCLDWFDCGIFPATIMFIHNYSYDDTIAYLKEIKAKDWELGLENREEFFSSNYCAGAAFCSSISNGSTGKTRELFYLVLPDQFDFSDKHICILAHEVVHLCQFVLRDILDRTREYEAEAYLHTYLMSAALKSLRDTSKEKRTKSRK